MRFILPAALFALICAVPPLAQAQGGNPQHLPLAQRFQMANVSRSGCLTQQEAYAGGIRWLAKNFPMVDTMGRGCVTFDQVKFAARQRREARMQQRMEGGGQNYQQGGSPNYQQGNQMPPDMRQGGPAPSYQYQQSGGPPTNMQQGGPPPGGGGGAPMPGYHVGQNPGGQGGPPGGQMGGPGGPDDDDE